MWHHGYFYAIDALFILFGLIFMYAKYRPTFFLLTSLLIISPIPEIIRKDQIPAYVFHSSLQYPILIIFAGAGLSYLLSFLKNNYFKYLIISAYFLLFINYLFIYFFQYPIYASESFNNSNRLLSDFLITQITTSKSNIIIYCREPDAQFKNYIFYSNSLNKTSFNQISQAYFNGPDHNYKINQLTFLKPDDKVSLSKNDIIIVENGVNAPQEINQNQHQVIYRLDNHQPAFNIYGAKN